LTAVNYSANAAREAASEVREIRNQFEAEFELTRDDLAVKTRKQLPPTTAGDDSQTGAA